VIRTPSLIARMSFAGTSRFGRRCVSVAAASAACVASHGVGAGAGARIVLGRRRIGRGVAVERPAGSCWLRGLLVHAVVRRGWVLIGAATTSAAVGRRVDSWLCWIICFLRWTLVAASSTREVADRAAEPGARGRLFGAIGLAADGAHHRQQHRSRPALSHASSFPRFAARYKPPPAALVRPRLGSGAQPDTAVLQWSRKCAGRRSLPAPRGRCDRKQ
jgi:hypothetical protein